MISFIEILRAVAVALITNSHFDGVYPIDISFGGCPGVSLFFAITGFLLWKPAKSRGGYRRFTDWYLKKLIRLYVPLTIVNLITVAIRFREASISLFLFPININLWYVPAIAVLYILFYLVMTYWPGKRPIVIGITIAVYALLYIFAYDKSSFFVEPVIWFRLLYGIIAMMIGSYIREYYDSEKEKRNKSAVLYGGVGVLSLGAFLVVKLLLSRVDIIMQMQFLTQVFGVAFAAFSMLCGCNCEGLCKKVLSTRIGTVIGVISKNSLEIYLAQFAIIAYLKNIMFPVNLIAIVIAVVAAGAAVHSVSEKVIHKILKI